MLTLVTIPALAGALLLCYTGLRHLSDSATVRGSLLRSGLASARVTEPLIRALPWAELATGGVVVTTFILTPGLSLWTALAIQTGLFLLFTGYLVLLRVVAPGTPCGCTGGDSAVDTVAMGCNVVIAGSSLFVLGTLITAPALDGTVWSDRAATVVLAAVLMVCYLLAQSQRRSAGYQSVSRGV